jgi:hypothetical protein
MRNILLLFLAVGLFYSQKSLADFYQDYWSFRLESRLFFLSGTLPNASSQKTLALRSVPILPVKLSDDWMWISVPYITALSTPRYVPAKGGFNRYKGLADTLYLGFLTPKKKQGFYWGLGIGSYLPTATQPELGAGKWQLGPSGGIAYSNSTLSTLLVFTQLWSIAGQPTRPSTSTLLGFFNIFRFLPDGWKIGMTPEMQVFWKASGGNKLQLPLGLGGGKTVRMGKLPIDLWLEGDYYVVTPKTLGPEWLVELRITPFILRP